MKLIFKYQLFLMVLFSVLLTSCSKNVLYLSDIKNQEILKTNYQPYRLQPYDYLYISIKTTDQKVNKFFQSFLQSGNLTNNGLQGPNYYLTGYMVNDSGYIVLPLIGSIKAQGLTVEEFKKALEVKVSKIIADADIKVKLVSYEVYFIGGITSKLTFYKDRVNILEAVAQAGGIPYYIDKKHVYVLRRRDSVYQVYTLNLTSSHVLENKEFYLQPFDIVYFKPRKAYVFQMSIKDYYIFASALSSVLSLTTLILTIINLKK